MTKQRRQRVGLGLLAGADVAALALLRPGGALVHGLAAPHRWIAAVGPDHAAAQLAGAALWLVAGWLGVGLGAGLVAARPGRAGRAAGWLARRALPRAVYRLAAGAAGLGVLCAPVAAAATAAHPHQHQHQHQHRGTPAASSRAAPAWPTGDPVPAPRWPTSTGHGSDRMPTRPGPARPAATSRPPVAVVVAAGDSLWHIAADQLPRADRAAHRIARAWPRWFAANRAVIGPDPNHITPGQVLIAPESPHQPSVEEDPS